MDCNFGEFITNEYGLLKQILSYLKPSDLHNARLVCREWRKVADNLIDKNVLIISYKHGEREPMSVPNKPILPDLVLYQNVICEELMKPDKCSVCKQRYLVCYCEIAGPKTVVLTLNNSPPDLYIPFVPSRGIYSPEMYSFGQLPSALAFSFGENIKLSTYKNRKNVNGKNTTPTGYSKCWVPNVAAIDDIKGIFVVSKHFYEKDTENLLNEVVKRHGTDIAVGGGITTKFVYDSRERKREKTSAVCVIFRGDNISAHSELIIGSDLESIENSMSKLKKKVGEVPDGGTQIAFIAQCVDRRVTDCEKLECDLFRKYFPNVPQFGFPAYGELGILDESSDEESPRKRQKLSFIHGGTTSILILTLTKL